MSTLCPGHWGGDALTIARSWGKEYPREKDRDQSLGLGRAHGGHGSRHVFLRAKASGARAPLTHQPWPVGDAQGTPPPPEDRALQQAECSAYERGSRGQRGWGGGGERTGQQELRARTRRRSQEAQHL